MKIPRNNSSGVIAPLVFITALPVILLLVNDAWSWDSTRAFDNHVYVGFFKHHLEFTYPFTENYKSSRLPFILPGVFLYRYLPDELAHQALLLLFLCGQAFFTFLWTRRHFGPHAAFTIAAAQVVFTNSHHDPSYHNLAASTYLTAALFLLDAPQRWPFWARFIAAGAAFSCAVFTNSITAALSPFFAFYVAYAIPRPWRWFSAPLSGVSLVCGCGLAVVVLGGINALLGGPFLFFMELVYASLNVVNAKVATLSNAGMSQFNEPWNYPLLLLPTLALISALFVLCTRLLRARFDIGALVSLSFITTAAIAITMQARYANLNHGIFEHTHLFSVFMVPTWIMLGATLRCGFAGRSEIEQSKLGLGYMLLVSILCSVPLAAFGMDFSLHQLRLEGRGSIYASGFIYALRLFLIVGGSCFLLRSSPRVGGALAAFALGVINPLCPEKGQLAHLYDYRSRCSFRQDNFSALIEADRVFGDFDPTNRAHWTHPVPYGEDPVFHEGSWCTYLPIATVARSARLTRYFFTTAQFTKGFVLNHPLQKLSLTALNDDHATGLLRDFKASHPGPFEYAKVMTHTITRPTFSIVLHGYEVTSTTKK
jgi:hypothetical protein